MAVRDASKRGSTRESDRPRRHPDAGSSARESQPQDEKGAERPPSERTRGRRREAIAEIGMDHGEERTGEMARRHPLDPEPPAGQPAEAASHGGATEA